MGPQISYEQCGNTGADHRILLTFWPLACGYVTRSINFQAIRSWSGDASDPNSQLWPRGCMWCEFVSALVSCWYGVVHLLSSKVNNGSRTSMISEYWDEPIFVKRSLYIKIYRLEKIVPCCDAASKFFSSRHTPSWHSCIDVKYTSIWGLSV